ncbi:hypothetical protein [Puniceicoccus vermicola]|nr:hypothetical protein [Puniceicoccus vermicola]
MKVQHLFVPLPSLLLAVYTFIPSSMCGNESSKTGGDSGQFVLNGPWQIQPASDFPAMPSEEDWAELPHLSPNQSYDWRYLRIPNKPASWKDQNNGNVDAVWWRTQFELPETWKDQRVLIDLKNIQGDSILYCNGQRVTELLRPGGEVELTGFANIGKNNELLLYNTRDYQGISRGFEEDLLRYYARKERREIPMRRWGLGISNPITVEKLPTPAAVTDVFPICSWRNKNIELEIEIDATDNLDGAKLDAIIQDADGREVLRFESQSLTLKSGRQTITLEKTWPNPTGWQLDAPYLYTVQVSISRGDDNLDETEPQPFGFREFWADGKKLYINGINTRLRTSSSVGGGKSAETLAFYQLMGYNFIYIQPNPTGWWQDWKESRSYAESTLTFADEQGIGLSLPIPGIDHFREKLLSDPALREVYFREQEAFIKRYRGHPSVLFWTLGMNMMNPKDAIHPTEMGRRSDYQHPLSEAMELVSEAAKEIDPNTLVYSHADGNQLDMSTSNLYPNFLPLQEQDDWPMYWAESGNMPFCAVELGNPITANFIKGQQVYLPEFMAMFLGDEVYDREKIESIEQIGALPNGRWAVSGHNYIPLYQDLYWDFQDLILGNKNRAWRTYSLTALGYHWDYTIGFGNPPGFRPGIDKPFTRYEKYFTEIPTEVPEWVNENFYIHRKGQQPLLTYIAGFPTHTDRSHAFYSGNKIKKQIAFVWDGPGENNLSVEWKAVNSTGDVIDEGDLEVHLQAGDVLLEPFSFRAPTVEERESLTIQLTVQKEGKLISEDEIQIEVFPPFAPKSLKRNIVVFDPEGMSLPWIQSLAPKAQSWEPNQSLAGVDLLVLGRESLKDLKALPYSAEDIRSGLNVLILQQMPEDWETLGLNSIEVGTRILEPRNLNRPGVTALTGTDLSTWSGDADLLPENKPARSYDTRRAPRVNNKHVVAPVMLEIPQRVGFTPLIAGEFDMNYSPLLRFSDGKGQVLFSSLALTHRVGSDPAPTLLANFLLEDTSDHTTEAVTFLGQTQEKEAFSALGLAIQEDSDTPLVIAASDCGLSREKIESMIRDGKRLIYFRAPSSLLAEFGYQIEETELYKVQDSAKLQEMGFGPNLLRWRSPLKTSLFSQYSQPTGASVLGDGLLLQQDRENGSVLFAQWLPEQFDDAEPYSSQVAAQRLRQLTSQLLTEEGASPAPSFAQRVTTMKSGPQFKWISYWHILGPIPTNGKGEAALKPSYPGEEAALAGDTNPNFQYQQSDGNQIDFRKTTLADENGFVNIGSAVNQFDGYLAYATTVVESEEARAAILKLGADYWADVYLNGKQIYHFVNRKGSPRANTQSVKILLQPGENVITVKVVSGSKGFGFWASLSEGNIDELKAEQDEQEEQTKLYSPLPKPFDPYEYHYW